MSSQPGGQPVAQPFNWARNVVFGGKELRSPSSVAELQEIVRASDRVRALGSAHSFNRIADTTGVLVSTSSLPPVVEVVPDGTAVRVAGGCVTGAGPAAVGGRLRPAQPRVAAAHLGRRGVRDRYARLRNANQSLAASVTALDMVTADGGLARLERGSPDFAGAVVGLGSLGIVTTMELEIVPAFEVRQFVYEDLPFGRIVSHFDEIFSSGYSVSVFTDWRGDPGNNRVWQKQRIPEDSGDSPDDGTSGAGNGAAEWLGGRLADGPRHPVPGMAPDNATEQLGIPGPWQERLPHFRLEFTPSSGKSCRPSICFPASWPARPSRRWPPSVIALPLCSRSARSERSRPMTCG